MAAITIDYVVTVNAPQGIGVGDLWTVRIPRGRMAKLAVQVIAMSAVGVQIRDVTRDTAGHGAWYNFADIEWCERIGRAQ